MIRVCLLLASIVSLASVGCRSREWNSQSNIKETENVVSLEGTYLSKSGFTVSISGVGISIKQPNGTEEDGTLERDGTIGASYIVRFPEGHVCGTYKISLWVAEGQMGDGSTFKMTWNKPNGSVVNQCGYMAEAEGAYKSILQFAGSYRGGTKRKVTALIADGSATFTNPDGTATKGVLEREGTLGASYLVKMKEGFVCGQYRISLWVDEGLMGDGSTFNVTWIQPNGTVVNQCGYMKDAEGKYSK